MNCRKCRKEIPDGAAYCQHCGVKQSVNRLPKSRGNGQGSAYKLPNGTWCMAGMHNRPHQSNGILGNGFGGPVRVKVTMNGDRIAKIDVLSHSETAGVSNKAFETIPQSIIDAQSAEVDVAAGATYSSNAIMEAVKDALSKVGK